MATSPHANLSPYVESVKTNTVTISSRSVIIDTPPTIPAVSKAIIVLHGGFADASFIRNLFELKSYVRTRGFYAVYPEGSVIDATWPQYRIWNADDDGGLGAADDVAFITAIITYLRDRGIQEVYLAGHSNGAMMTYRYIAEHPENVDGVIAVSGFYISDSIVDDIPLNILHIHGTADATIDIAGLDANTALFESKGADVTENRITGAGHSIASMNALLAPSSIAALVWGEMS